MPGHSSGFAHQMQAGSVVVVVCPVPLAVVPSVARMVTCPAACAGVQSKLFPSGVYWAEMLPLPSARSWSRGLTPLLEAGALTDARVRSRDSWP